MKRRFTLQAFLYLAYLPGFIALVWLSLIPGDPKSAWIFGISKFRAILLVTMFLLLCLASIFSYKAGKDTDWSQNTTQKIDAFLNWDGNLTTGLILSLSGLLYGSHFLYTAFTTTDLFIQGYFSRLAPFLFWFAFFCGLTLCYIFRDIGVIKKYLRAHGVAVLSLLVILVSGLLMHTYLWDLKTEDWDTTTMFTRDDIFDLEEQDIFAIFIEGDHLQQGRNPYARALDFDHTIEWNQIFATYLPVSYTLSWFIQEIGLEEYLQWLSFWRVIFLIANLGITYLLFYIPYHRYNNLLFAIIAGIFWLFNRWTLHMTMIYHIDFIAIFFLLISLVSWPKRKIVSLLAFGLSLSVKHIAMFMIPLYIIWIWQSVENLSLKQFIQLNVVMASIPFLVSLPFIIWNAEGFVKSIFVSATRISESHFGAPAIDTLLTLSGIPAKIPMLVMMALIFLAAWKKKINIYAAAFFMLIIFVDFNSVLFRQYMTFGL